MRGLRAFDAAQQRSRWLALPVAVFKKFFDDNGGQFAGLMAYYGFFSLFPLLLVLVTVLGLVLHGDVSLQHRIEDSSLAQFPIIGTQIRSSIRSLNGGVFPLAIGLVGAVWGGLAFTKATQIALDRVWAVPQEHRHSFVRSKLRGVMLLAVLGGVNVVTTALDGFVVAGGDLPQRLGALGASIILDFGLFVAVFVLMTSYPATVREILPGAIVATIAWEILQHAGGYLVAHQFKSLSSTYGLFALVLGTLAWLHIGAQSTLYAAELNVVRSRKLWPRSIF
jgi:YihY family inner membrane protein